LVEGQKVMPKGLGRPLTGEDRAKNRKYDEIEKGLRDTGQEARAEGFRSRMHESVGADMDRRMDRRTFMNDLEVRGSKGSPEVTRSLRKRFNKGGAVPDTASIPTPRSRVDAAEARAKEIGANSPSATVKSMLEGMERYKGKNPPPPKQRGSGGSSTPTGSSYRKGGMVGKTRSSKSHVNWGK
jgi:hypothetical protein